jgi:S-(hydroxymethyl)glutathione dehydrogenase/alcohol dehydrogenase
VKSRAAVLHGLNQKWTIEEIEVHPPKPGEVLVQWKAAGLCHSDEHLVTGDMVPPPEVLAAIGAPPFFPMIGGHEGAGVVLEVGPGVTKVEPGDHVAASFVPACGHCRYCLNAQSNLCNRGAETLGGPMITDGTYRTFLNGEPIPMFAKVGTFSEYACVADWSVIKVDQDLPLECVALVSCGVATGFGSATKRADIRVGDTVVIVGIGGIGINALQGAKLAGAKRVIAIDPLEFKRRKAKEFGATHAFASMEEAFPEVNQLTDGEMADKLILSPSVVYGELMQLATALVGKGGTVVVTGIAPMTQTESSVNLFELAMWNKEIKGTIFGSMNPPADIPRLLGLYREGLLKLDELITTRYTLDEINDGYEAMREGTTLRGVIIYD